LELKRFCVIDNPSSTNSDIPDIRIERHESLTVL